MKAQEWQVSYIGIDEDLHPFEVSRNPDSLYYTVDSRHETGQEANNRALSLNLESKV